MLKNVLVRYILYIGRIYNINKKEVKEHYKMKRATRMSSDLFDNHFSREIKSVGNVFGEFLVNKGLYDEIEITSGNVLELIDLVGGHVKIDVYCPKCGESRVFSCDVIPYFWYDEHEDEINGRPLADELISVHLFDNMPDSYYACNEKTWSWINNSIKEDTRLMVFKFVCAMDNTHHLDYIVLTNGNIMKKIGQFPSVADLSFPELKEYRKVMTKEDEKELKRAIGLYASGIGVGSFVYLRRIFERIIVTASNKAMEDGKIIKEDYDKAHVDDKIKMLADYLPGLLVNNTVFYGIVSKGIHELSEEECIEYFPIMKSFIMMILRQWEKIRRDEEEVKKLASSLNKIVAKVK